VFEDIKDAVRRDMAAAYLRQRNLPLSQVAELLGYAEPSALSRSCRRWFGETPSAVRRRLAA
jgi:AraC-like DNA-binding protein